MKKIILIVVAVLAFLSTTFYKVKPIFIKEKTSIYQVKN